MPLEPKTTQVQLDGVSASQFFDSKFVGAINKEIPEARFEFIGIAIPIDKKDAEKAGLANTEGSGHSYEHVQIGHFHHAQLDRHILVVDCDRPETLKRTLRALSDYLGEEK